MWYKIQNIDYQQINKYNIECFSLFFFLELNIFVFFKDLDTCIGCLQTNVDVKLVKNCDAPESGQCRVCFCRPMWCLECLGKWFASRQDQARPDTWLQSTCPCPSCRSLFCVLDISLIEF